MADVTLDHVSKQYADGTQAVSDLNLEVGDGEFMVLIGPSGCGKTTALRMVAGLEEISDGVISIGGRVVNGLEPRKRDIAMVFQNYALYPHMTVFDNIAFPLRSRGLARRDVRARVEGVAEMLGISGELTRRPRHLSGGQRQRVAMGRAIVREPQVFLMDEPLSNLDAKLRVQMRADIATLQRRLGVTTIYVTHDQIEAMTMATRIAVLRRGVLQQVGAPRELHAFPANIFVGTFIGSPAMNLLRARIEMTGDVLECVVGDQRVPLPASRVGSRPTLRSYRDRDIALGIRPDDLSEARGEGPVLVGKAVLVEELGSSRLVHAEVAAAPVMTDAVMEVAQDIDASAVQHLQQDAVARRVTVVARVGPDVSPPLGENLVFALDANNLHFFDLDSGEAVA